MSDTIVPLELNPVPPPFPTHHADAAVRSLYARNYRKGDWNAIIKQAEREIASFVERIPNPILSNSALMALYFGAEAYRATGQIEKYIGCLKILYSLKPYEHTLGGDHRGYVSEGFSAYPESAEVFGIQEANDLSLSELFKKSGSGCFIATAAYGDSSHDDVRILRDFRDEWLLRRFLGRVFVCLYYVLSPHLAAVIARFELTRKLVRLLLKPVVKFSGFVLWKKTGQWSR